MIKLLGMKMKNVFTDSNKMKLKIDKAELISEILLSHKTKKVTTRLHELIHLLCYKLSSKYISSIIKINVEYDDFVNDVYIYVVQQVFKFNIEREKIEPFSYFTTCATHEITHQIKKHITKYVNQVEWLDEYHLEQEINDRTGIYRKLKTKK